VNGLGNIEEYDGKRNGEENGKEYKKKKRMKKIQLIVQWAEENNDCYNKH
jgi:hypothetical protein